MKLAEEKEVVLTFENSYESIRVSLHFSNVILSNKRRQLVQNRK